MTRRHAISCNGVVVTRIGTAGNDTITGTSGDDVIFGFGGDDFVDGRGGNGIICGGAAMILWRAVAVMTYSVAAQAWIFAAAKATPSAIQQRNARRLPACHSAPIKIRYSF